MPGLMVSVPLWVTFSEMTSHGHLHSNGHLTTPDRISQDRSHRESRWDLKNAWVCGLPLLGVGAHLRMRTHAPSWIPPYLMNQSSPPRQCSTAARRLFSLRFLSLQHPTHVRPATLQPYITCMENHLWTPLLHRPGNVVVSKLCDPRRPSFFACSQLLIPLKYRLTVVIVSSRRRFLSRGETGGEGATYFPCFLGLVYSISKYRITRWYWPITQSPSQCFICETFFMAAPHLEVPVFVSASYVLLCNKPPPKLAEWGDHHLLSSWVCVVTRQFWWSQLVPARLAHVSPLSCWVS